MVNFEKQIETIITEFKSGLTLDGKMKVFEDGQKLNSSHIIEKADPEAYTSEKLVSSIIDVFEISKLPQKHFRGIRGELRKVDYHYKNKKHVAFLAEIKPVNTNLFDKSPNGAVNQIRGVFRLVEVKDNYSFGIATDGLTWVFIDNNSQITYQYDIRVDCTKIKDILVGKKEILSEKYEEEISQRFYNWYSALLFGGKYKDSLNRTKGVAEEDSLIENILFVQNTEDKEKIAQTTIDRLIFIKFLRSKNIITFDILEYLDDLNEDVLNEKLKQLFFQVLNTPKEERVNIDEKFKEIPYLNGSLFIRTETERNSPDYKIRAVILKEVIKLLNSFRFTHTENVLQGDVLDPEILGYIFERLMTASDRKGTGAYYTPKHITRYITEQAILPVIIRKVNGLLISKGYKETELIKSINQIYSLRDTTLLEVYNKIILNIKLCDTACGSGAFLLAAADFLLRIYKGITEQLNFTTKESGLKVLIVLKNLFGVDINPNAVDISKLRLWLWVVSSYEPGEVFPLPNIDYNLRVGNSLIGYIDIKNFKDEVLDDRSGVLGDFFDAKKEFHRWVNKRKEVLREYKKISGKETRNLGKQLENIDKTVKRELNTILYESQFHDKSPINYDSFLQLNPFHWGFEFEHIFSDSEDEKSGFDVIIGNPPYFKVLEDNVVNLTKEYQEIKLRMTNIAAVFINRNLKLCNEEGSMGLIVPKMLAYTSSWEKIRTKILTEQKLTKVIDCGKAFKGVLLEQIIFILLRDKYSIEKHNYITIGQLESNAVIETARIKQELCLNEDSIYLEANQLSYEIKEKMEASKIRLREISKISLGPGIQGKKELFSSDYKQGYSKVLSGNDIQRYYIRSWKYYNPLNEEFSRYKDTIEKFEKPHIIAQRIVAHIRDHIKITATFDSEGLLSFNTVTNIFINDEKYDQKFILGILNSNAVQFYTYKFIYNNAVRSMDFYEAYAGKIPIPNITIEKQKELISIVEQLLELSNQYKQQEQEISELESQLNKLVYSYYELSADEIGLIETSMV